MTWLPLIFVGGVSYLDDKESDRVQKNFSATNDSFEKTNYLPSRKTAPIKKPHDLDGAMGF
jgi:hypothetical protein